MKLTLLLTQLFAVGGLSIGVALEQRQDGPPQHLRHPLAPGKSLNGLVRRAECEVSTDEPCADGDGCCPDASDCSTNSDGIGTCDGGCGSNPVPCGVGLCCNSGFYCDLDFHCAVGSSSGGGSDFSDYTLSDPSITIPPALPTSFSVPDFSFSVPDFSVPDLSISLPDDSSFDDFLSSLLDDDSSIFGIGTSLSGDDDPLFGGDSTTRSVDSTTRTSTSESTSESTPDFTPTPRPSPVSPADSDQTQFALNAAGPPLQQKVTEKIVTIIAVAAPVAAILA